MMNKHLWRFDFFQAHLLCFLLFTNSIVRSFQWICCHVPFRPFFFNKNAAVIGTNEISVWLALWKAQQYNNCLPLLHFLFYSFGWAVIASRIIWTKCRIVFDYFHRMYRLYATFLLRCWLWSGLNTETFWISMKMEKSNAECF